MARSFLDTTGLTYLWNKLKNIFVLQERGKGLSTNDYTTDEKTKLAGLSKLTPAGTSSTTIGGVRYDSNYGVKCNSTGLMQVRKAENTDIDAKTSLYRPIVPYNLDYAVKSIGDTTYAKSSSLSTVATSGSYADLINKPMTILPDSAILKGYATGIYLVIAGNKIDIDDDNTSVTYQSDVLIIHQYIDSTQSYNKVITQNAISEYYSGGSTEYLKLSDVSSIISGQVGNPISSAAVSNALDKLTTYSTTETDTGMIWIDGKTIYRKTFIGNLTTTTNAWVDTIRIGTGIIIRNQSIIMSGYKSIPFYTASNYYIDEQYLNTTGYLQFYSSNSAYNNAVIVATIEYTKTS